METLLPGVGISFYAHTSLTIENLAARKTVPDNLYVLDGDTRE